VQKALGISPASDSNTAGTNAVSTDAVETSHDKSFVDNQPHIEKPNLRAVPIKTEEADANAWNSYEIPGYLRNSFQIDVMPVLVSRCGQSGCHGSLGKNNLRITQPTGNDAAVMLDRNLTEVLKFVERRGDTAQLLDFATRPHGIQKNPSINAAQRDERALLEKIEKWITLLRFKNGSSKMPQQYPLPVMKATEFTNEVEHPVRPASAMVPKKNGKNAYSKWDATDRAQDRRAKLSKPSRSGSPTVVLDAGELSEIEEAIKTLEQRKNGGDKSRDPFDPNIFNQQFGKQPVSPPR
jgi:hypothetical protein